MAKTIEPKERYLDVNGIWLHYLDWGNCGLQPVLLLHGFLAHVHVWDDFALVLEGQYHVIALDQRGHGESQWREEGAYSIYDHFSDLLRFIKSFGLKNLIIMGHSMGGRNALFYTACNPEMVKQLILVDVCPGNDPASSKALKNFLDHIPLQAGSVEEVMEKIHSLSPYLSREICEHVVAHGFKKTPDGMMAPKFDVRTVSRN